MSPVVVATKRPPSIGMGEMAVASRDESLYCILGSCVGLVLYHPRLKMGALAHIVLPKAEGRTGGAAKFADLAIPRMLSQLAEAGANQFGLVAKMFGGGSMFGTQGPMQIGQANIAAVHAALEMENIPVIATDLGGNKGRAITLTCATGQVKVEIAGHVVNIL